MGCEPVSPCFRKGGQEGREFTAGPKECALPGYDRMVGSPIPRSGLVQLAFIEQPEVIAKILTHFGLWPTPAHSPPVASLAA
jgi:hypothetical protein